MNARLLLYHFIRKCSYVMKKLRGDRTAAERKMTLMRSAAGVSQASIYE